MNVSTQDSEVLYEKLDGGRIFLLNRPKVLNSLNLPIIRHIYSQLQVWDRSEECKIIIIKSSSPKAYCAGGDVVAVVNGVKTGDSNSITFFEEEYRLNHALATLKTPLVAFINGITMGGGVGLSVHSPFRVATESTMFAMPETRIGFLPDVGGSFFLPRLDGETGTYLALTGERLKGEDTLYAGIATHFVPAARLEALEKRLCQLNSSDLEEINKTIEGFVAESTGHKYSLAKYRDTIDRCFKYNTMEEIFEALENDDSEFAKKTLKTLGEMSPTSLKVTLQALRSGRNMDIAACLRMEYRLVQSFLKEHDFAEGVTKALITKTRDPKWSPSTIYEVDDRHIQENYFLANHPHSLVLSNPASFLEYPYRHLALPSETELKEFLIARQPFTADPKAIVEEYLSGRPDKRGILEKMLGLIETNKKSSVQE
ncbi:mitochondrial short-chain enoyl-coenzyme A hydratase 1-like protein [Basidiobolus meristosporus CBS 931.73]|uniref:3-hydroxyisobutyryl-CoA hydrolase n=1 Tax=Basidiobolus meristosporus CBS 931.73 TaxID=1314790 RepID=A0A1Y1X4T4_9FUNG|nr:mitochondrial short-chain enoyl-coenzyme A hydratase 1-like protein [Basidiobolus meristosporus CBS 931.73]|eukprot:ORX80819.1 mitochondrial short-chain enoyl-coenzyme A hydratase 1-like protein [Basidiobolus meristosporus CBS 931.73]